MTQYDAGPGDLSDREWESPSKKNRSHARRRRVTLPPWALLAILIAIIILLCTSLILIVKALRSGGDQETPTPTATATRAIPPTATWTPTTIITQTPTATVVLPIERTPESIPFTEIVPGATVVVQGTAGAGLNLRQQPTTSARVVDSIKEGTELLVIEGPSESDGYVWWKLRAPDGTEGWGATNWLTLKTE
jgi:cytoskeletal protein RodZ